MKHLGGNSQICSWQEASISVGRRPPSSLTNNRLNRETLITRSCQSHTQLPYPSSSACCLTAAVWISALFFSQFGKVDKEFQNLKLNTNTGKCCVLFFFFLCLILKGQSMRSCKNHLSGEHQVWSTNICLPLQEGGVVAIHSTVALRAQLTAVEANKCKHTNREEISTHQKPNTLVLLCPQKHSAVRCVRHRMRFDSTRSLTL